MHACMYASKYKYIYLCRCWLYTGMPKGVSPEMYVLQKGVFVSVKSVHNLFTATIFSNGFRKRNHIGN